MTVDSYKKYISNVLIIHPEGNTFNNPTLKSLVDLLLQNKVNVTIRCSRTSAPTSRIPGICFLPYGKSLRRVKNIIYNKLCSRLIALFLVWLECLFVYKNKSYNLIIGVDREGLIEADAVYRIRKIPFVFFSFEIMFEKETSRKYKELERKASKFLSCWFVQDEIRANCIQKENNLNPSKKRLVPLASKGQALSSSLRLRDKLEIQKEKKVAIVMGTLSDWSMTKEILLSVSDWPDNWVLIVHERYGNTVDNLKKLGVHEQDILLGKIYFSSEASVSVDRMEAILAGVSVGLAFYRPIYGNPYTGNNLKYLGLASGKISTFLRYGIPIITNPLGLYSDLAQKYNFGLTVETHSHISKALVDIENSDRGLNAQKFYESHLDFSLFEQNIWNDFLDCQAKCNR